MSSEKFCLRWNDFESNISVAFRELRDDKDFFDVTLACDDEQLSAHKVILSACSPFFRNVLRRNPHQHPLLYLKGVKYTDLQAVLNFMYHGEVNVAQEELNSFLAVAEDLRVKGLTQNQGGVGSSKRPKSPARASDRDIQQQPKRARAPDIRTTALSASISNRVEDDDIQEVVPVKSEPRDPTPIPSNSMVSSNPAYHTSSPTVGNQQSSNNTLASVDDQALSYQDESYEDYGQYEVDQSYDGSMAEAGIMNTSVAEGNKVVNPILSPEDLNQFVLKLDTGYSCTICHKQFGNKRDGRNHCEALHFPNSFVYNCDFCGTTFNSKNTLNVHQTRHHREERHIANKRNKMDTGK